MDYKKLIKSLLVGAAGIFLVYLFFIYLPRAFSGEITPSPILLSLGSVELRWYGFLIALGAVTAYLISVKILVAENVPSDKADLVILLTLLCGLIGARLGFVIQDTRFYLKNIADIFKIWEGGLSIHGALLGGILGLLLAARVYKLSFLKIANAIAPQVMLAAAIGRWGNFFNGEVVGRPTDVAWRMYVSKYFGFFHPVFLYESLLLGATYVFYMIYVRRRFGDKYGLVYTLIFYSLIRIIVEFFRSDYKPILWKLDLAHLVSFGIIAIAIVIFWLGRRNAAKS